jgi:hypothetical protein
MTIQSIQKMMVQIGHAILTALYEGLSRYGCSVAGWPHYEEEPTLGTVVVTECELAHIRRPSN